MSAQRSSPDGCRSLAAVLLAAGLLLGSPVTAAPRQVRVVTTSTTFSSLVEAIGGENVTVDAISPPCDDIHFIEPRPSDILKLARAHAFVHAGLDLELWRFPLVEASRNRAVFVGGRGEIDLSRGIELLEVPTRKLSRAEGDIHVYGNPHYWMDPDNLPIMAAAIANRLSELAPEHAEAFESNREALVARVAEADEEWKRILEPHRGASFVPYHRDWPYFARHFGLGTGLWLEPKPNIPPSAKHLQQVIGIMREQGLRILVREPFHPRKTAQTVARATGARSVLLYQHAGCHPGTDDYVAMLDANVRALAEAFDGREAGP